MDKVIFTISKTELNQLLLEDMAEKKTYKFNDLSEIIDVFANTDHPKIPMSYRVVMRTPQKSRIHIYQRMSTNQKRNLPKYFWTLPNNVFGEFEKVSVREVLKHIQKNVKSW